MKRPTNALPLAVLALLFEKPMHPYEISTTLRERRKEESIRLNYGSLYAVVESLCKKGLIEARETIRDGNRPQRTIYELTEAGESALRQWLGELLSEPSPQFTDFEAALSLMGAMPPEDAAALLTRRVEALTEAGKNNADMMALTPPKFPRLFMIEAEYQEVLREAELAFVRQLLADMESGALTGMPIWRRVHELRSDGPKADMQAQLFSEFSEELAWGDDH
jgi:DNA-binding PadR family transcriptional regulator